MVDDPLPHDVLRAAQRAGRQVYVDGQPWLVYELPPLVFDRRTSPSLVFETDGAMRRVRNFPPHWRDLTDEDLFALSWGA